MDYYSKQLEKLKDTEYFKSIIVLDGEGNKTNQMDINLELIEVLIQFLKNEKRKIKR